MIRRLSIFVLLVAICYVGEVFAQVPPKISNPGAIRAQQDTAKSNRKAELLHPWKYGTQIGYETIADDSLLRWQIWPNWGEFYAYRHDVISARQGGNGRTDAYNIGGYGPYEQQLIVDGINMVNPVTGLVNYNLVPSNKIGKLSEIFGTNYRSDIRLKEYYITKPISYLNYDEAKYNFRNLEFMVAQNFRERTNIELSFWDRRDGGEYQQNDMKGSQIVAKGYYFLKPDLQIKSTIISSNFDMDESFGYDISQPQSYGFGKYDANPLMRSVSSELTQRDIIVGAYMRPDSVSDGKTGIALTLSGNKFRMPSSVDTLRWDISSYGLQGHHNIGDKRTWLNLNSSVSYSKVNESRNFEVNGWLHTKLEANANLDITSAISTSLNTNVEVRNTGQQGYGAILALRHQKIESTRIEISSNVASTMPTIQHLYWNSGEYSGSSTLKNKSTIALRSSINQRLGKFFEVDADARYQILNNDFWIGADSSFTNSNQYSVLSASFMLRFQNHRFEIESSAAAHALAIPNPATEVETRNVPDQKIWIRNNVFVRGYLFNRAAYVRGGIRTTLSPTPYYTQYFNTALQFWENAAYPYSQIPAYFRLDAELSARVRAIMVLLRWENTLEGFGQLGYFETATFPMPGRRLIVGIRAQFRN